MLFIKGQAMYMFRGMPAGKLKLIQALIHPRNFMPCTVSIKMLHKHANWQSNGLKEENIFVMQNGDVLEICQNCFGVVGSVDSGVTLIDGLGIGDVGKHCTERQKETERRRIVHHCRHAESGRRRQRPRIISRGFVYMRESEDLLAEAKTIGANIIRGIPTIITITMLQNDIKSELEKFLYERTKRRPMILPVFNVCQKSRETENSKNIYDKLNELEKAIETSDEFLRYKKAAEAVDRIRHTHKWQKIS
jgi:ribonuclease J